MKTKKTMIILILVFTMIFTILVGCTEKQNSIDEAKIIGIWHGRYFNIDDYEDITTDVEFFENNTAKTIYYLNASGTNKQIGLDWAYYKLNNGELCFKKLGDADDKLNCEKYEFSSDYEKLFITLKEDPDFLYELTRVE
jgi:hypothetical protein